jgi:quercetin dioxygenase-like cupin family protein
LDLAERAELHADADLHPAPRRETSSPGGIDVDVLSAPGRLERDPGTPGEPLPLLTAASDAHGARPVGSTPAALAVSHAPWPAASSCADDAPPWKIARTAERREEHVMAQASGEDPIAVDSGHYTVELENERVRVLRIRYGPGDRSVMHVHPDAVAVSLKAASVRFHFPDGESQEMKLDAGQAVWTDATTHEPENVGDEPFEIILIELKG